MLLFGCCGSLYHCCYLDVVGYYLAREGDIFELVDLVLFIPLFDKSKVHIVLMFNLNLCSYLGARIQVMPMHLPPGYTLQE